MLANCCWLSSPCSKRNLLSVVFIFAGPIRGGTNLCAEYKDSLHYVKHHLHFDKYNCHHIVITPFSPATCRQTNENSWWTLGKAPRVPRRNRWFPSSFSSEEGDEAALLEKWDLMSSQESRPPWTASAQANWLSFPRNVVVSRALLPTPSLFFHDSPEGCTNGLMPRGV